MSYTPENGLPAVARTLMGKKARLRSRVILDKPAAGDSAEVRISPDELTWKRWDTRRS